SITQINSVLDSLVAWVFSMPPTGSGQMPLPGAPLYPLQAGSVSALYFAERVYQFPLGVFGVALGTVLFPLFARHAARHEFDRLRDDLSLSLRLVLVVGLPASVGMWAVADDLVQALLQHGRFDQADATRTASMIAWYSLGVWAYCAIPVLFRGFYALGDRTTPLRIGMLMVGLNLLLNVTLIWVLAERGLALSTALAAMLQAGLLTWGLQARLGRLDWSVLALTALRCACASAVMLLVCQWVQGNQPDWERVCAQLLPEARRWGRFLGELIRLMVPVGIAGLSYLAVGWLLGMPELKLLLHREPGDAFQSTPQPLD
ncbi:MAG: murein biosynthesis integral membrane protein MurJ, partial [Planctomycetaceae bacterium]